MTERLSCTFSSIFLKRNIHFCLYTGHPLLSDTIYCRREIENDKISFRFLADLSCFRLICLFLSKYVNHSLLSMCNKMFSFAEGKSCHSYHDTDIRHGKFVETITRWSFTSAASSTSNWISCIRTWKNRKKSERLRDVMLNNGDIIMGQKKVDEIGINHLLFIQIINPRYK